MPLIVWWFWTGILGVLAFPLAYRLFPRFADRGYALSRALGLLISGYVLWLGGSVGIVRNDYPGAIAAVLVLGGGGLLAGAGRWGDLRAWIRQHRSTVLWTEALFLAREMLPNEEFSRGDTVRALIIQVQKTTKGTQIFVSRTHPKFLAKLLELEIPEIANGNIEIKDLVRQPGERAKVAVLSKERDIDPIGACIGVKGNRILNISKELQGEKIDVVAWSAHPPAYAKAALSPARVEKILLLDKAEKALQAIVPRDQLSLAIGKKGINVKLASRLVGWKIEIKQVVP